MNVAINTLPLSTEHRMRGTGVYTKNLIDALTRYQKQHTYTFFTRAEELPRGTDVIHYPFFDPFFLTLPFRKPYPTLVTVHDVIPLLFPDKFPAGVRGGLKWQVQRMSLKAANGIITDSRCSKKDIMRIIGKSEAAVHVVPLAPSPQYVRVREERILMDMKRRYHIPDEYVLYIGDVNWNKNVPGLLDVWKLVRGKLKIHKDCALVLAGSAFTDNELPETRAILRQIGELGLGKTVLRPGFIKDEDMSSLYSGARCLVLPSWYEGFGFPVLESMACGTPVVATNRGSVPEISGPAVIVDPDNAKVFASALVDTLRMPDSKRVALVERGIEWARRFTWKRVAEETSTVYESVGRKHP